MATMNEATQTAIKELERKAEELKAELKEQRDLTGAIAILEAKAAELKDRLTLLAQIPVPVGLLDFYIQSGGNMAVSKLLGVASSIRYGGVQCTFEGYHLFDGITSLKPGAYHVVLLAIPQPISEDRIDKKYHRWRDDYGRENDLPEKGQ